ncbi:hypothetical protein ACG04Q_11785 [Roseateles sp. DXS20W]|uniref:DUF1983 domain-containing protein n=1 Tax=Pelomonas lactea TaxID=3299030 RepID=A0ABW7GKC4_9BURK
MPQTIAITEDDGLELIEDLILRRLRLRIRRDVVAYLGDLADPSRADRGAGVMAFNPLLDYPVGSVGARLKAIITGIGEGQPWADVDALLDDLVGKIDLGQLHASLQATIDLITADATTTNSVNKRLADEAAARSLALLAEAQDRANAISTAIGELQTTLVAAYQAGDSGINSRITTEIGLSQDRDTALGARIDTVTARLNSGGDIFSAIATALSYSYSKATIDSAIAASAATLTTNYQAGDTSLNTRISNEAQASSDRDTALGSRVDTITARLNTGDIATSLASLATYAYTKAQTDGALSSLGSTLRSEFTPINNRLNPGGDIYTSLATANSYAYTKAQSDSALSSLGTTLTSSYTAADDVIKARLNAGGDIANAIATASTYAYTKAQVDGALSSLSTSLTSSFTSADDVIKARLNAGGDIATAIANASTYAYTKAQTDSAIASSASTLRSEFNPINARLNAGGDIYSSLSTALTYAYTRAQSDSALATQATTLRSEYNGPLSSLNSSVSTLQTAVAGAGGLQAQFALKTVATRSDGRPVIGYVGLASTAPSDGTGGSELILQAGRILFVPDSNPNAAPSQMMVLGTVNGVSTLVVPAAVIGDATIAAGKLSVPYLSAISGNMGTLIAGSITAGFYQSDVPGAKRVTINEANDVRIYSTLSGSYLQVAQIGESYDSDWGSYFAGRFGHESWVGSGLRVRAGSGYGAFITAGGHGVFSQSTGGIAGIFYGKGSKGAVVLGTSDGGAMSEAATVDGTVVLGAGASSAGGRMKIANYSRVGSVLDTNNMTITSSSAAPTGGADGDLHFIV